MHEQTPEGDEGAVGGLAAAADRCGPAHELRVALARTIDVDAVLLRRVEAVLAEAGDAAAGAGAAVIGDEHVAERSLPLAAPHQAVDVVGPQVVLDEPEPEVPRVGIARAGEVDAGPLSTTSRA